VSKSSQIRLHVVSAEGELFNSEVTSVSIPAADGEIGVHPQHTPLLTRLNPGELRIEKRRGEFDYLYISGGMVEIQPHCITILADSALRADDIDEAAAIRAKRHAEEMMSGAVLYSDRDAARTELMKAVAQLQTLRDVKRKHGRATM
jgi:F-type H+-transporting ATPase subunit epsilon